eukprot:g28711.t1
MGSDEDLLPADIKKEILKKVNFVRRQPKKGDEVEIHYTASLDGALLDAELNYGMMMNDVFTLGMGSVMEAWDRIVATMRKGEIARFTVPEMYLSGGPSQYLAKLPDDGQEVRYEMELVQVVGIRDLFGDGSVIERIHDDGEEYGISPKAGDELQINYELSLKSGKILDSRPGMDFRTAKGLAERLGPAVQRAGSKEGDGGFEITEDVLIKIQLLQIYEFEDCGKKAFWEEGLVLKKAIQPQRCRLCPGRGGTRSDVCSMWRVRPALL